MSAGDVNTLGGANDHDPKKPPSRKVLQRPAARPPTGGGVSPDRGGSHPPGRALLLESGMPHFSVKNWAKFQHYKNRKPPWIKLYTSIIDEFDEDGNPNDTFALSDSAKLTLLLAWLLASHFNGHLPDKDAEWFSKRLGIREINFKELIDKGFVDASELASEVASNIAPKVLAPETEGETYTTETENREQSKKQTPPRFTPPSLSELNNFIKEKSYTFSAEAFIGYYDANGWRVGKNPMRNWKGACATWQNRQTPSPRRPTPIQSEESLLSRAIGSQWRTWNDSPDWPVYEQAVEDGTTTDTFTEWFERRGNG